MRPEEIHGIAAALGSAVLGTSRLAGGFSHETCLLTLTDGQVVVRLGGAAPAVEAAVMAAASRHVPVPQTLLVMASGDGARPAMVLEYVAGTPLSRVLSGLEFSEGSLADLGAEVGRVVAGIGAVTFERRGFFADENLSVNKERPWSGSVADSAIRSVARCAAESVVGSVADSVIGRISTSDCSTRHHHRDI
ncbi:hypothetical protein GCM10027176_20020 [Actinoallomurus bryophytorum]|nr:phosphotransferase [Actinoallomurus bryophytorum]